MKMTVHHQLPLLKFDLFEKEPAIMHAVTTRSGGVSNGAFSGLNLSYSVPDDAANVVTNRGLLARAMGVAPGKLVFQKQTHSANFRIITESNCMEPHENTDALITAAPGIAIAAMSADCVPILLFDRRKKVIAAIHAGWRGTVSGIVVNVVNALQSEFGTDPSDLIAGIGPCISAEAYETGPEVIAAFRKKFHDAETLLSKPNGEKAHVDLRLANRQLLLEAGIPSEQVETAGHCTYNEPGRFFSARFSGNRTGRFAAVICLSC